MRPVLLAFLLLLAAFPAAAATLAAARVGERSVTLALDGPVAAPRQFAMAEPRRLIVDLAGVQTRGFRVSGEGPVALVRAAQFDPATARVVVELTEPMRLVRARQQRDGTLVLSLAPVSPEAFARGVGARPAPLADYVSAAEPIDTAALAADFNLPDGVFGADARAAAPPATNLPPAAAPPSAPPPPRSGRKPLVVIDPGHGGKDVGAIAVTGQYEKDATLAIAKATAEALRKSGRVRVKLTRDDDRFIPLAGRIEIARRAGADLFVSIHADSAPNPLASGASVYTLSEVASDAVAARLAARENKADAIHGVNIAAAAPEVSDIMIDLVQRDTMNASVAFAEMLQASLSERIPFRGQFHRFAGFWVLKAPDVPSVLLETGYVSNEADAKRLFSKSGQRAVALGIAAAVEAYLLRAPSSPPRLEPGRGAAYSGQVP